MTEVKAPVKKRTTKKKAGVDAFNCYFCDKLIENTNDLVIKIVPLVTKGNKVRNYKRQLHLDCVPVYNKLLENDELKQKENSDWDLVYQYFRSDILETNTTVKLPQHAINRLLGLRLGTYVPQGNNTRLLPRGYDFKTILVALKVTKPKLLGYLRTTEFADTKHRIDGIMRFVVAEIPDVHKRMEAQSKANKKLDEEVVVQPAFDYKAELLKQKQKKKEESNNSVADDIASLLGGSL